MIARALATGRCELVSQAFVERIDSDGAGHVAGVTYIDARWPSSHSPRAEVVICAAGAIETARLLLNSASDARPARAGQRARPGRAATCRATTTPARSACCAEAVHDGLGPGVTTATVQFNHGNAGVIGGGMLADEFIVLPIIFWARQLPPDLPRWGAGEQAVDARKLHPRAARDRPGAGDPQPRRARDARPGRARPLGHAGGAAFRHHAPRDGAHGRVSCTRAAQSGCAPPARPSCGASRRACSSAAASTRPAPAAWATTRRHRSWIATCRVHGHDNLYVADGSVHVTNGGFNPVLTIMALAFRTAEHVARQL